MATVCIDATRRGSMHPVHGVGQPPFVGMNFSKLRYLTEAGIPFSRLHDVGGYQGQNRFVDIPNVFRDFDADPAQPENYDFTFTDKLMEALAAAGVEPYYRLGVTIENDAAIKAYRIHPPRDSLKWAKICEGIIRHYTEGWADGYRYGIRYWEIWNEPENGMQGYKPNMMWTGTMEEYFELYRVSTVYLKEKFPHLKFGGYAACGFYNILEAKPRDEHPYTGPLAERRVTYFTDFLRFVKENGCPLDFFSWHSYEDEPANNARYIRFVRRTLDEYGFQKTESHLNEWNGKAYLRGSVHHAAVTAANLIVLQNEGLDAAMFYDARWGVSMYSAMFNPLTGEPFPAYYPFLMYHRLYRLGVSVAAESDTEGVWACAAEEDGTCEVLLANTSGRSIPLKVTLEGYAVSSCRALLDGALEECALPETLAADAVLSVTLVKE